MGNFDMLPEEIMFEILSRVPTESALECKFVSKTWRSIIQHPSFSQMHLNHLNNDSDSGKSSFIFWTQGLLYYIEYDESLNRFSNTKQIKLKNPLFKYYLLEGSCNGLLCLYSRDRCSTTYICTNPITREYIVLPKVEGGCFLTGFGYIPSTNEYKVVSISRGKGEERTVQVYTLGSGVGWRNVVGDMPVNMRAGAEPQTGKFVNGAIHWEGIVQGAILAFDLAVEEFREISLPPCLIPSYGAFPLYVLGGFLCVHNGEQGRNIWVYKKNKNNQDMIWSGEFRAMNGRPITVTKTGELVSYICSEKKVYLCPPNSFSRMLVNFGENFSYGTPHRNTLVSLKSLGEEDVKLMDSGKRRERSSTETQSSTDIISQTKRKKKQTL